MYPWSAVPSVIVANATVFSLPSDLDERLFMAPGVCLLSIVYFLTPYGRWYEEL
jgi:hypothetical protein